MYAGRLRLDGKTALVVGGGGGGIGTESCCALAEAGAWVAVFDQDEEAAGITTDKVRAAGGTAEFFPGNAFVDSDIATAVDQAISRTGRLDILVTVIGRGTPEQWFHTYTDPLWDELEMRNLRYAFNSARAAVPRMIELGHGGRIVTISSLLGRWGRAGSLGYSVFKAGLEQMTRSIAVEVGHYGIRINTVRVGGTATPQAMAAAGAADRHDYDRRHQHRPLKRSAAPDEQAAVVLFLCSDLASFVTGQVITVDGGLSAKFHEEGLTPA